MKAIKFRKNLSELVLKGEKTTTWRIFDDKNISVGDVLSLVVWETGEEFAKAKATKVIEKSFKDLNEEDWEGHEKFDSEEEMYKTYSKYYNQPVGPEIIVKIIKFNLV